MGDDEAAPVSAAESLKLIEAQRDAAVRSLRPDPRFIYWPWGLAWLVGFGLLFLRHGPHEQIRVSMPDTLPLATLFALMIIALLVSGVAGARANRQISGDSSVRGLRYGLSWLAGFAGNAVVCAHFSKLLPAPEVGLLWAATSVGLVGVLYLTGSAVWQSRDLFVLGIWLTISNIVGVLAGPGWHSLVISVAGGGGLLVAGFAEWLRWRHHT
ncbi:transporter [Rugosimonospora africana]|uniref:Uncharacterized protein n=1 Tax=Rugosimonospora africana TaxID=556532 RepID=A0A8J3R124_9ACTN|nr:transporter [Rugosimonospora africana]GIH20538.1 hypothetical protein Raf01_87100 [Rugosimonospora africana]